MKMINNFRIDIGSDPNYEDLIAEIYYQDVFMSLLSQERGFENLEIEIYPPPDGTWKFAYADFEKALTHAKKRLWELRKIEK